MTFENDFSSEIKVIKSLIGDHIKLIAQDIYVNLCNNSPSPALSPFSSGSYVLSHRINSELPDLSITKITTINKNALSIALNELSKLNQIEPLKVIIISNSIDYNEEVEYLGWGGSIGPYNTFQKTEGIMETIAQQIMDKI